MNIYFKILLYGISFVILFYNVTIAFGFLIATHGLIWYLGKEKKTNSSI